MKGRFTGREAFEISQRFSKSLQQRGGIKVRKDIFELKQAAFAFWNALLMAFKAMIFEKVLLIRGCASRILVIIHLDFLGGGFFIVLSRYANASIK
jgi:hypothetical protein